MNFDEWFADWVKAAPEWNDAAGNYETIASEAWEYQEQQLAELEAEVRDKVEGMLERGAEIRELRKQLAELEAENARLREGNTYMWKAKYEALEQQLAALRLQTTECNGFDCCPLAPELAELRANVHEACEVYAGMEGFIPVHAETGYVLQTIEQMYKELLGGEG